MKEIGGYIELDRYTLPMLHENAKALNCGRNCLAYLIRARGIKKIALPYFLCDSVKRFVRKRAFRYAVITLIRSLFLKALNCRKTNGCTLLIFMDS